MAYRKNKRNGNESSFCFQCSDFPCETLNKHGLFGEKCIRTLEEIRDEGLEDWIKKNYG